MEFAHMQNKMKLLFEKIAQPNFSMDSYYCDLLVNKLSNCDDPEIAPLKMVPLFSDLILGALINSKNNQPTVRVLITRMLAIASQMELHFLKMFAVKGEDISKGFEQINSPDMNASLRAAYLEVALALINHVSGVLWLLRTDVWKHILGLCNDKKTVYVVRQRYQFASKFLWKLNDLNDDASIKLVLDFVLKPVNETNFLNLESMTSEQEEDILKTVEPMLQILLAVVSESDQITKPGLLLNFLLKEYSVVTHLYILSDRIRKEEILLLISKNIFLLTISKIFVTKPLVPDITYNMEDFVDLGVMHFNFIQYCIQRRCATLVLDFCNACIVMTRAIFKNKSIKLHIEDGKVEWQHQLLFICLVPSIVYVKSLGKKMSIMTDERLNEYSLKFLNTTCEHTARAAYALRDLTLELDTLSVTLQSIRRLNCLKNLLNDEQANLVFQALFFILKEYDPIDDFGEMKKEENYEESQEKVLVMTYVLDMILTLVKNHNINWHESLEVICLYTVVFSILKRPNLTTKFIVTALNVITLSVKKFLPPNLSLLMETTPGSTMHELGKLIYMKLHDIHWEVRDSALELLLVCTEIAYIKFPSIQKQILENNLINVAATMAFNDYEYYVQVSALKCIGAGTKITRIWEQLTQQYPNIKEQIMFILRNHQEGIVRKEACKVLIQIYQNIKLTPDFKEELYAHMVSSALSDFHWEVQLGALKFWKTVIKSILTDQGMLDGAFPPVTFSRESRKIVTLNEIEIQKRLLRTLEELSSIGCLTVLVKLLDEESEVEIMSTSLMICRELLDILKKYKVPEMLKVDDDDPKNINEVCCRVKEEIEDVNEDNVLQTETTSKSDSVIEDILNADDVNLLAHIYEKHLNLQADNPEAPNKPRVELVRRATPYLFVTYLNSKDFEAIIDEKSRWKSGIRSLSSLFDDVLGIYEVNEEINTLDCY